MSVDLAGAGSPHLLMFGINYSPEKTGIGPYTSGLAEELAHRGWGVTVVTGIPHYPSWRASRPPGNSDANGAAVLRRRHYVPPSQSAAKRGAYEVSWLLRALPDAISRRAVDVVLGVVPSLGGGVLAATAAARHRVPFGLVFQDLMGRAADQSGVPNGDRVSRIVRTTELAIARRAAAVGVVAGGFGDYLCEGGVAVERVHRVRNWVNLAPALEAREETRHRLGWSPECYVVLHSGNMGYKQGLEGVLRVAALLPSDRQVLFVLQGDGSQRGVLERQAEAMGLTNVAFLPLAPTSALPSILAAADVLLLHQRPEVGDMALPSKLTSYFASGRPVLAIVASGSEAALEVRTASGGVVVPPGDPGLVLSAIRELQASPSLAADLGKAGQRYARECLSEAAAIDGYEFLLRKITRTKP